MASVGNWGKAQRRTFLSSKERKNAQLLIVEPDSSIRNTMRQSLTSLGFMQTSDVSNYFLALDKAREDHLTHVIFDATNGRMKAKDFLSKLLEIDNRIIAIPSSYRPTVDDVFDLLIMGARGYICKPFSSKALDDSLLQATKGEAISDAVLFARNRNEALAAMILASLKKLALLKRQAKTFDTAKREIPAKLAHFKRAVEIGNTFAKGGPTELVETIVALCIERADAPAPKMSRIRRRWDEGNLSGETAAVEVRL